MCNRFAAMAGVELIAVEQGYAKARMVIASDHLNAVGVCQGGALFTLADLAFAAVANNGVVATFGTDKNAQSTTIHIAANDPDYAGEYKDTVTFTVAVKTN